MKTILITGSNRGLGRALAEESSKRGYSVILHGRTNSPELDNLLASLPGSRKVVFDVMDSAAMKSEIDRLVEEISRIDTLINNAGMLVWKKLTDHTDEEIEQAIRVNLEAPIKLTKYTLPHLKEGVINIASAAARDDYTGPWDFENETTYAASKFGLRGFSFVLAKEYKNLKVLCANPGGIATDMNDNEGVEPSKVAIEVLDAYENMSAGGKWQELNLYW